MRAQKYLQNIPESLKQADITEGCGNRQLKEWVKKHTPRWRQNSVGESNEVKKRLRTSDKSEPATGTTGRQQHQGKDQTEEGKERKGSLLGEGCSKMSETEPVTG